ncbi:lactoylglutathione lyase [Spirochaetia bacterium]|nr:lactoylglutathione lyase [Spirochaetia bacterium]GHU32261.1 lactoylglutathione lyase [Spirochaetia bacterium]
MTGLAHLAITVKDMEKSLDFYTRILGFRKVFEIPKPQDGSPWIVYLHVGGRQFIELFYGGTTDNPFTDEKRGFNHICLEVDDIQEFTKKVLAAGYKFEGPTDVLPNQGCDFNWQAWMTDPDGIRVELMQIDPKSPHYKVIEGKE